MSELDYLKGMDLTTTTAPHVQKRLEDIIETLEDYVKIYELQLEKFIGKRESKNKDIAMREYRFHRDILYFLKRMPNVDPV